MHLDFQCVSFVHIVDAGKQTNVVESYCCLTKL